MRNLKLITSFGLQIKEFPSKFYEHIQMCNEPLSI